MFFVTAKRFRGVAEQLNKKTDEFKELKKNYENFTESSNKRLWDMLCETSEIRTQKIKAENKLKELEIKYSNVTGSKGGLTKQLNKVIKEKEELNNKLINLQIEFDKFKENKFIVKSVPEGRKPNTQVMKVKKSVTEKPSIRKHIKEELDK